jgi:hypothetical protein
MLRRFFGVAVLGLFVVTPCFGQEWAQKMFKVTDHDFGSVARGAKAEFSFVCENIYLEDIHLAGVRTSCGCTTPRIENSLLKTYDKGAVVAHFNTDTFTGPHGATLTVTIDKPFFAEVQLHVKGDIRTDVVVDPGSVQYGAIDQGIAYDQHVSVNYGGGGGWQILDVKSFNPHITAKAVEASRSDGQVSYTLNVRVDAKTPAGYLNDHLILVTNDATASQIPVLVEGQVTPGITVNPTALFMGVVQPGQKVTKQLVVKSKKPFKILGVSCDDKSFQFDTSKVSTAKELHLVPVTFTAGADAGKVMKTIKITTDQGQMTPELAAYAVVAVAH